MKGNLQQLLKGKATSTAFEYIVNNKQGASQSKPVDAPHSQTGD